MSPTVGPVPVTVAIPTYGRDEVLTDTIASLFEQRPAAAEILVVDQTVRHAPATERLLEAWEVGGRIRILKLPRPSVPLAMNCALMAATQPTVLFLDDDIVPEPRLITAHWKARANGAPVVAGRVLQPGEESTDDRPGPFRFASTVRGPVGEFMAGNVSIDRALALRLGGFDENFVGAAYRFERDFARRLAVAGIDIHYEPDAGIRHLRAERGGTRAHGHHLTTFRPSHAVGEYYFLLRTRGERHRFARMAWRPLRAVRTRHHLRRPWWIPVTLVAESLGFLWACLLAIQGPRLIGANGGSADEAPGTRVRT